MTNEFESFQISVFGEQYTLHSDEPAQQVVRAAALVDSLMKEIAAKHAGLKSDKIAVLAAIRIASSLLAREVENEHTIKQEIVDLIEQELHI